MFGTIHPTATPSHAPRHNREYVHTASNGDQRVIFADDTTGDRWYLLNSGRYTHAGFLPSTAAGRYAYDASRELSAVSPRRAYRALHDAYSLETPATIAAWDAGRSERLQRAAAADRSRAAWGLLGAAELYYSGRERSADDGRGL